MSEQKSKDKYGREFFEKPRARKMNVFNRSFRFGGSTAETHANDIFKLFENYEENKKPKILGILCDNGPDFSPSSWLVFSYMGKLWKDLNLDQLIICSYAPRSSRFNPIEIAWGTLSQALAQITLVSDHQKYNYKENKEDLRLMFIQAQDELKEIWSKTLYAGKQVNCVNISPSCEESPYREYDKVKDALKHGRNSENHQIYKEHFQFLLSHCVKRSYYLHFKKCKESGCEFCTANPIKNEQAYEFLEKFDKQLPRPILFEGFYGGDHYPSLLDLMNNEDLQKMHKEKEELFKSTEKENICKKCK